MTTKTSFGVAGFSKDARDVIASLEAAGVTFRLSSKNHAIGTAPYGLGTVSVPRKFSNTRARLNNEAQARRMLDKIAAVTPITGTVNALGQAANALLQPGSEVGDKIIANGIQKKVDAVTDPLANLPDPGFAKLVSTKPWLAHKSSSKDGGTYYESPTTNERVWSDGTVDYVCSYCGEYSATRPKQVVAHYSRSNSHPKVGPDYQDKTVPGVDYVEPLTHRHSPSQARIDAILAILAAHPEADHDLPLNELVALILAADMERDPLYERGDLDGPLTDGQIIARIRLLVGSNEEALRQQVSDLTKRLADSEAEVERLKNERAALRDLLSEEGS